MAIGFLPHLVRGGRVPTAVGAIVLTLASLVLIGAGLARLMRDRSLVGRLAAVVTTLVVTGVVVLVVSPAVAVTNVPRPTLGATPAGVGLVYLDPDRMGVVGLSMGGEEAIGASATDGRIRAVVAEGATARMAADEGWLSTEYGIRGWVAIWTVEGAGHTDGLTTEPAAWRDLVTTFLTDALLTP